MAILKAKGRIWFESDGESLLGKGRIELLKKIKELGSIRQAALHMKMSYRQAWQVVDYLNERSGAVLVTVHRGGKGGGRAILTAKGEKLIETFIQIDQNFQQFLLQQNQLLSELIDN